MKFLILIAVFLSVSLSTFFIFFAFPHQIMSSKLIYWSKEWMPINTKNGVLMKTVYSGSELDFDFRDVKEFSIKGFSTNTNEDTTVVVYLDNKAYLLPIDKLQKGEAISSYSDAKNHTFRLIFYCRGYNPCNFTLTNIAIKGGTILKSENAFSKTIGIVGDSISLLYAKDNYSSILSRNISYHLHNASVWGRSLAHTGKISPAVNVIGNTLLSYRPNIVIVMLGTNDVLENVKEDDFLNDYKKLINQIQTYLPESKIVIVSIYSGRDKQLQQMASILNSDMETNLISNSYYVDVTSLLEFKDYGDAIHPNMEGQIKIANFLKNYLVSHKLL